MAQVALQTDAHGSDRRYPVMSGETRERLGTALRAVYEGAIETQPIPDAQIDLLLRLRHKERDQRRSAA
jgi:hypothetical protein